MPRDIIFGTHLDGIRRAVMGNPPACVEPMTMRLQPGSRTVWAEPPPERSRLPWYAAVLRRLPLGDDDDRHRVGLGRVGGGGEHVRASVARVP